MSPDTSTGNQPALTTAPPPTPALRRRLWPWLVALLVIAVIAGAVWYAWPKAADAPGGSNTPGGGKGGRFDATGKTPLPVVAAPATKGSIDVYLNALGSVTPRNVVTVKTRVDGQLMSVSFSEGQIVKAGDLLAQIDPRPFQVALTQAIGQQAKDQALLKNAQLDLERYRTLLSQDSISKQQVDTQEALVRQYEGTVQSDQGAVDSAKLQLTYSRVTAPITGRVGLRQVDPGNVVHASDTTGLVIITQLQPMTVVFPIPEDDVPRVMKRMQDEKAVVVEAWDRDQKVKLATGKLLTVDNQIDPTTGTVKLKSEFANDNLALFPNQFVNVRMLVQTLSDATLIPSAAIQRGAPGTFVYVVKGDQTVSVVPVKLGPAQGEITSITSGLTPGDVVVTDGADKLREGAKVELITRDAQTAPPQGSGRRGQRGDKAGGPRQPAGAPGNGQAPPKNGG
jgi:membrane fusion protein, multidrug efflux system